MNSGSSSSTTTNHQPPTNMHTKHALYALSSRLSSGDRLAWTDLEMRRLSPHAAAAVILFRCTEVKKSPRRNLSLFPEHLPIAPLSEPGPIVSPSQESFSMPDARKKELI